MNIMYWYDIMFYHSYHIQSHIGPILDDRLKEKLLKPWKVALCFHFRVCLSVRLSAGYKWHLLTLEPNFWDEWSSGHEKETHFFIFLKFSFLRFLLTFFDLSKYNTSIFYFFQATGNSFSPRDVIIRLRKTFTIRK